MGAPALESDTTELTALHSMLKSSLLFSEADAAAIDSITKNLVATEFKKGDPVILEGELGEDVFFVKSGSVEIVKYRNELRQLVRLAVLTAGMHFSEFSVLNRASKSASAFALEDSVIYKIGGKSFLKIVEESPRIGQRLLLTLAELIHNSGTNSSLEYFDPTTIAHSSSVGNLLPPSFWNKFGVLPLRTYPGILLVATKNPNNAAFYEFCQSQPMLRDMQVNIVLIGENDFEQTQKRLNKMYGDSALRIPARTEAEADAPPPMDVKQCLWRSQYFAGLAPEAMDQLASLFEPIQVKAGDFLFNNNTPSEFFYMVMAGQLELSRPTKHDRVWSGLKMRGPSQGMGEISMILNHPHSQAARATCDSTVLRMPKRTFDEMLGSGLFCLNLAKLLALRLQAYAESASLKFYDGAKPEKLGELNTLIPKQFMKQHQVLPLKLQENEITLGVVNPENEAIFSIMGRYLRGYRVRLELISADDFKTWITDSEPAAPRLSVAPVQKQGESAVVELTRLLQDGFETRASDLHIEPTGTNYTVRYRVDGVLSEAASKIPAEQGAALVSRIKVISGLDISNHLPQDGQFKINEAGLAISARVATTPTKQGEGAVLRLIRNRGSSLPLAVLAPDARTIKILRAISRCKQGLFLVTGPTGSGKTTTLYSLIAELNRVDVKIISIEDPVELEIPGISQIEVNEKTGLTFERALKSTLRQDPDVLFLGEIRDPESARSVFEAALSGHFVISTLHTNNSFAVRNRLKELGVPPGLMAAGLQGAMAQRLVRAICKKCRTARPISNAERTILTGQLHLTELPEELYAGQGCIFCHGTGFHGRIPIMEVWRKNRTLEDLIARDQSVESMFEAARANGFATLFEFGLKMALHGLTTVEEVDRVMAGGAS